MTMPTFERKFFINKLVEEIDKKNEVYEKNKRWYLFKNKL